MNYFISVFFSRIIPVIEFSIVNRSVVCVHWVCVCDCVFKKYILYVTYFNFIFLHGGTDKSTRRVSNFSSA